MIRSNYRSFGADLSIYVRHRINMNTYKLNLCSQEFSEYISINQQFSSRECHDPSA